MYRFALKFDEGCERYGWLARLPGWVTVTLSSPSSQSAERVMSSEPLVHSTVSPRDEPLPVAWKPRGRNGPTKPACTAPSNLSLSAATEPRMPYVQHRTSATHSTQLPRCVRPMPCTNWRASSSHHLAKAGCHDNCDPIGDPIAHCWIDLYGIKSVGLRPTLRGLPGFGLRPPAGPYAARPLRSPTTPPSTPC
jgi:hypothetical protein